MKSVFFRMQRDTERDKSPGGVSFAFVLPGNLNMKSKRSKRQLKKAEIG